MTGYYFYIKVNLHAKLYYVKLKGAAIEYSLVKNNTKQILLRYLILK